jgi:hypothetical protein
MDGQKREGIPFARDPLLFELRWPGMKSIGRLEATSTPYQTEGLYLVYARVFPSILLSTVSVRFLSLF